MSEHFFGGLCLYIPYLLSTRNKSKHVEGACVCVCMHLKWKQTASHLKTVASSYGNAAQHHGRNPQVYFPANSPSSVRQPEKQQRWPRPAEEVRKQRKMGAHDDDSLECRCCSKLFDASDLRVASLQRASPSFVHSHNQLYPSMEGQDNYTLVMRAVAKKRVRDRDVRFVAAHARDSWTNPPRVWTALIARMNHTCPKPYKLAPILTVLPTTGFAEASPRAEPAQSASRAEKGDRRFE